MQIKAVVISVFVATAFADTPDVNSILTQVPACALPCLIEGASAVGCDATNYACQCGKADQLTQAAGSCVDTSCSADEAAKVAQLSTSLCDQILGTSSAATTAASSAAAATSAAASSAAASSAASSAAATKATGTGSAGASGNATFTGAATPSQSVARAGAGRYEMGVLAGAVAAAAVFL